jgi:hypothetical protein
MRVYVIEWQTDNGYWMSHGIGGIFLSRKDAVAALERTEFQCFREVPNGMWKLIADKPIEFGTAHPRTKDGEVWEIYGPNGMLVDGSGKDEPEYRINGYEVGRLDV